MHAWWDTLHSTLCTYPACHSGTCEVVRHLYLNVRARLMQDLTSIYLSTESFLTLLTRRLDSMTATAVNTVFDVLKEGVCAQVKIACTAAKADPKLEQAMGRKATELMDQV